MTMFSSFPSLGFTFLSFPRTRESRLKNFAWIPARATLGGDDNVLAKNFRTATMERE
jgi:hypothetical protein